jgi:protein-disulfide isomerase
MRIVSLLLLALLPGSGIARAEDTLTPAQSAAVDQLIHDYLIHNPKVLIEALKNAQAVADQEDQAAAKAAQAQVPAHRAELEREAGDPVLGNPAGDVTIVEFFDYRCPYCKSTAPVLQQLLDVDHKVRLVMKNYPILGKDSVALVAQKHGRYAAFNAAIWALQGKPTPETTLDVVRSIGLDPAVVQREMESPEIDAALKRNFDLGRLLAIDGTPTFIIGDETRPGIVTLPEIEALVAATRKPG